MPNKKQTVADLVLITVAMLIGEEGVDFSYMEGPKDDPQWWALHLYCSRN